jgi:hypothetical protein
MLIFKQEQPKINESLILTKVLKGNDQEYNKIIVASDQENPTLATKEIIDTRDILKKYKFWFDPSKRQWILNDRFQSIETMINIAKKAVAEANKELGKSNEVNELIQKLEDVRDAVMTTPISPEAIITKEDLSKKIDIFINELADEVDNVRLTEKIKEYFDWLSNFPNYSFNNQFLIFIQNRKATKVNSKSGWLKLGYAPKQGANQIILWRPTLKPPSAQIKKERKENFMKKFGKNGKLSPDMIKKMEGEINEPIRSTPYILYPVYDIADVVNDKGEKPSNTLPKLDWFSTEENPIADKIFDAMTKVYEDYGIDFAVEDAKGSEKGYSAGGKVRISTDAVGVGKASTAIHEFAHELMHQTYLKTRAEVEKSDNSDVKITEKTKHILDAYVGRNMSEILELQAESVAYVVLKSFDIPDLKYAINYIALWRGSKDSILGNLDVITTTSNIIIGEINKHISLDEVEGETIHGDLVSQDYVAKLLKAPIKTSGVTIDEIMNDINEAKKLFKTILI